MPWDCTDDLGSGIDGADLIHIGPVQQVERVEEELKCRALIDIIAARETQIPRAICISDVGISLRHAPAVISS
jgi:hypothetical protein